jgi:hypothetical protein
MKLDSEPHIRLFAAAMFRHWWELMSCAAFTVLGVYCASANRGKRLGSGWDRLPSGDFLPGGGMQDMARRASKVHE